MPGPPMPTTFTYDGTPPPTSTLIPSNTLPPYMKQTQRFWISADTGTHSRVQKRENIQDNPSRRLGTGPSASINHENYIE